MKVMMKLLTRRGFLTAASAAGAAAVMPRPDYILDSVKAAGYQYADMVSAAPPGAGRGGARSGGAPAQAAGRVVAVTPEMLVAIKQLAARGLKSNIASVPTAARDVPVADSIAAVQRIVVNAHELGQRYALNLGIYEEERWLDWCKVMREAAAFGQERGVKVVVKHHHGLNNTSLDLLAWTKQVNHPNFGIFVDPGSIVYYTGKDAVKQTAIIAAHVAGVVAKDCTAPRYLEREAGAPPFGNASSSPGNPEVMIQIGTGKVDFPGLFKTLKDAGFSGAGDGRGHGGRCDARVSGCERARQSRVLGKDLRKPRVMRGRFRLGLTVALKQRGQGSGVTIRRIEGRLRRDKGRLRCVTAVLALMFGVPALAQDAPPFRDLDRYAFGYAYPGSQLKDHIYERSHRFFAAGDAQRDGIRTVDAVRQRQEDIRRVVISGIGGLRSDNTPLKPRVTGTVEGDGFRIEKIIFESRPRHYVTANLYLPLNRPAGRTAAVLFLSGHHNTAKVVPEYQNVCQRSCGRD
jgi:sugar phosphate isomerase/epimerase